jgi:hypothetical protein
MLGSRIIRPRIYVGPSLSLSYPVSGAAPPFVPTGSPVARWDASAIEGLSDTDSIATWSDIVGSFDLTAAGAAQPTYRTDQQNGLPAVSFDGNDGIDHSGTIWNHTASDITMFVVSKVGAPNGGFIEISFGDAFNNGGWMLFKEAANFRCRTPDAPGVLEVSTASDLNMNLHTMWHDSSATTLEYWLNGVSKGTAGSGVVGATLNYISVGSIGANLYPLTGLICEILIYNTPLSTEDRQTNEAGLTTKWGIT